MSQSKRIGKAELSESVESELFTQLSDDQQEMLMGGRRGRNEVTIMFSNKTDILSSGSNNQNGMYPDPSGYSELMATNSSNSDSNYDLSSTTDYTVTAPAGFLLLWKLMG